MFVMTPPDPGSVPRLRSKVDWEWPLRSKMPPFETSALRLIELALPPMPELVANLKDSALSGAEAPNCKVPRWTVVVPP